MGDLPAKETAMPVKMTGGDEQYIADVDLVNGKKRLQTTGLVQIEQLFGVDPLPDNWFTISNTGAQGNTWRIQVAETAKDPTVPDRDLPAVDYTYTVQAGDVGDELLLAENIVDGLNADANFINAKLKAEFFNAELAIVHISSTEKSIAGDFFERPNSGDVSVAVTGSAEFVLAYDNLVSRGKATSLARDPDDPRIGVLGISGSINVTPENIDTIYNERTDNLAINPGGTPDIFTISANPAGGDDIFITVLKLYGDDGNIKVGEDNFLGLNAPLTNGIKIELTVDGDTFELLPPLKTTNDFLARFATTASDNKIINQSGGDFIQSVYDFSGQNLVLKLTNGTTDKIEVTVQDNLSQVNNLFLLAEGFTREP